MIYKSWLNLNYDSQKKKYKNFFINNLRAEKTDTIKSKYPIQEWASILSMACNSKIILASLSFALTFEGK